MASKIWVISELYYPEESSTGYFLTRIAEGFGQRYTTNVLCGQPTYAARGVHAPSREQRNCVYIHRCQGTTFNKDHLLLRLVNVLTLGLSIFMTALRHIRRHDCVLVVTNPPMLPLLIAAVCRIRQAKCLLLIHDMYPEVLVASGLASAHGKLPRFVGWLNRFVYGSAVRIIVLGRDMADLVAKKVVDGHRKIVIIPNWADIDLVVPGRREQNGLLKELDLHEKFVVQYAGNMGRTHGLETLLESASQLRDISDIAYLFIGSGGKRRWLEEKVRQASLSNVRVLPTRPRSDLPTLLNACDVAIIAFVPGMAGVSVPSRMYNILAAGKPIIAVADDESELARVVREERVGWVVAPTRADLVVKAIMEARAEPRLLAEMGARARSVAESKYSFNKVMESYLSLMDDALGGS